MTLQELFRGLARSSLTLLLFVVIGVACGVAYVKTATTVYTAHTQIFVNASDDDGTLSANLNGSQLARNDVPSYALIAHSPTVLSPVAGTFHLTEPQLASNVTTSVPNNTTVIEIGVADHSPQTAARIAAALASQTVTTIQSLQSSSGLSTQSPVRLDIIESATVPTTPTSPRPTTDLAIGAIVGLGVGVIVAAGRGTLTGPRRPRRTRKAGTTGPVAQDEPVVLDEPVAQPTAPTPEVAGAPQAAPSETPAWQQAVQRAQQPGSWTRGS